MNETCFVLMPFKEPFNAYFSKIILPAIEDCGLYAVRGDSLFRPSTIMDDVWGGIRASKVLIAELTERNPNVFYELGLAHALSKPVILISQSMDDVPFDLRSIRVILYDKDDPDWGAGLKKSISAAIRQSIEHPQSAIPSTFKIPVNVTVPEESEVLLRLDRLEQQIQRAVVSVEPSWVRADTGTARDLSVGDQVFHKKFGKGLVVDAEGTGTHKRVQVNFEKDGLKWMVQHFAAMDVL